MKLSVPLFGLFLSGLLHLGAADATNLPVIAATAAVDYIGRNVVVTGLVAEVHVSEKVVRLNFEKPFPKQSFTAVVFSPRTNLFPNLQEFKGKTVEVTGKMSEYRNRPEIVLSKTNQIRLLEPAGK